VERFLRHKDKVKITIMFRGREVTHPERGVMILDRLAEELAELGVVEQRPTQDGRNMTMMLGPSKAVLAGKADGANDVAEEVAPDVSSNGAANAAADDAVEAPIELSSNDAAEAPVELSSDGAVEAPQVEDSQDGDAPAAEVAIAGPDGGVDGPVS
jgi:translation initiation factor IF-3